jgi:hypothetical protein
MRTLPMMNLRRALFAAALLLPACTPPTSAREREYRLELGLLTFSGTGAEVQVPAAVQAGQPFTVRVVTWGSTCRRRAHETVTTAGLRSDVEVYVREPVNGVCNRALGRLEHDVQVYFSQPGTATVAIHGLGESSGSGLDAVRVVIERTVTVQ